MELASRSLPSLTSLTVLSDSPPTTPPPPPPVPAFKKKSTKSSPPPPPPPPRITVDNFTDQKDPFDFELSTDDEFEESSGSRPFEVNNGVDSPHDYRYEDLKDQLMSVVLENEKLAAELENVKCRDVKVLSNKLKAEQEKNRTLVQQLESKPAVPRRRKIAQSREEILFKSRSMVNLSEDIAEIPVSSAMSDEALEATAEEPLLHNQQQINGFSHRGRFSGRLKEWLSKKYDELVHDFSVVNTLPEFPDLEGEPLNPFKLKNNLLRFGNFMDPSVEVLIEVIKITRWENPPVSLLVFIMYMTIVYKDWLLTVIFLTLLSLMFFTYLRHKGWSFGSEVETIGTPSSSEFERDLGVKDQISVIMIVGRKSQNLTGNSADQLEKIRNLLLWREPELTKPVVMLIGVAFVSSLLFSPYFLVKTALLAAGVHVFIIQYIFIRFPRFDEKYNAVGHFIAQLKTDTEYEKEIKRLKRDLRRPPRAPRLSRSVSALNQSSSPSMTSLAVANRRILPSASSASLATQDTTDGSSSLSFQETFNLPLSEEPLQSWKGGRRCILVNRDKYFTAGFKVGKMYLSNHYLCYERSKASNTKNLVIPLETVTNVAKAKLYQWVPGGGKAVEVKIKGSSKPLVFVFQVHVFGPIVNRDEAYNSIMEIGSNNNYAWARQT